MDPALLVALRGDGRDSIRVPLNITQLEFLRVLLEKPRQGHQESSFSHPSLGLVVRKPQVALYLGQHPLFLLEPLLTFIALAYRCIASQNLMFSKCSLPWVLAE